ncbi:MAG TPA: response regulator [Bryobacteraceae bacterium]|jgi:two-component system response regulator
METPCRLLIVEDNPADVLFLKRAIREQNLDVIVDVAEDGEQAIRHLEDCPEDRRPHVIVIDIDLPKRDGIEVLHKCRFTPALADSKILLFTGSAAGRDLLRAEMIGVDAYLRKPDQLDDFAPVVETIRELLKKTDCETVAETGTA